MDWKAETDEVIVCPGLASSPGHNLDLRAFTILNFDPFLANGSLSDLLGGPSVKNVQNISPDKNTF